MTTEYTQNLIVLRPEIQSALDAMATATRRTRSEVISSLIEQAPLVRTVKACRNCGESPCRETCVINDPIGAGALDPAIMEALKASLKARRS